MPSLKSKSGSSPVLIIVIVVIVFLIGAYFFSAKFVFPSLMNKVAEETVAMTTDNLKSIDYSNANSLVVNQQIDVSKNLSINLSQNLGSITINGVNTTTSLEGAIEYLGDKPEINYQEAEQSFKYKAAGEKGENLTLNTLNQVPTNIAIASGVSIVNLNLSQANTPKLAVAIGAGVVNVTFSSQHSTTASLAAGVGVLNLKVPKNTGIKIATANGVSLNVDFGNAYKKTNAGYQSKNYDTSQVKIDLSIGQAAGGFNLDVIE